MREAESVNPAMRLPIRILNITSTPYSTGGVETLLLQMAGETDADRFRVAYCNLFFPNSRFAEDLRARRKDVFSIGSRHVAGLPFALARLTALLSDWRPDVVHTHMPYATIAGHVAAAVARVPVRIVSRHHSDAQLAPSLRMIERRITNRATHVVAVSHSIAGELVAAGLDPARISVVHNGISIDSIDAAPDVTEVPWPAAWKDTFIIGTVANLYRYKGHDRLIRAFATVAEIREDARLVIIGDGPEREALRRLVCALALEERVFFTGRRPDVPSLLRLIDLYVHPALTEPFGIAIIEAMAARLPVVCTAVGGVPEIILDRVTGRLVPADDVAALASAIVEVMEDSRAAAEMGLRGRERVERDFAIAGTTRAIEKVYLTALACSSTST